MALYELLAALTPTPVVERNRAVAVAMAFGPRGASSWFTRSWPGPNCATTTCCPSVRGDLLARLGRHQEARTEFERAASLARNAPERAVLPRPGRRQPAGRSGLPVREPPGRFPVTGASQEFGVKVARWNTWAGNPRGMSGNTCGGENAPDGQM